MSDTQWILDQLKNPYDTPPNFGELAEAVPEFKKQRVSLSFSLPCPRVLPWLTPFVTPRGSVIKTASGDWTIDWKNDEAIRYALPSSLESLANPF